MDCKTQRLFQVGALIYALCATVSTATSELDSPDTKPAYLLTLQVVGHMPSCDDRHSSPEYYATATRRDPTVEQEINAMDQEIEKLNPRLAAFAERIEHLLPRQHNTVPLTDDEKQKLESLRKKKLEVEQQIDELTTDLDSGIDTEELQALLQEKNDLNVPLQQLEEAVPLTEEEASFLMDQIRQRAPLLDRKRNLTNRQQELNNLISMRTPGSLRVYLDDVLQIRLMEKDVFDDDTCSTWQITVNQEILDNDGFDLKAYDRRVLRMWLQSTVP